ncbi:unnamed protein product [Acanthoscelides obtectus]|uniref:Uncharacterized protein n=1 Tax=Acanthoscelides obtectus TaxID=200917 RepID=A0A9P0JMJ5_ACAOB|nr:unnamed protein product [Acanthoscelides obtectus]CAK1641314.1 hypothetical protein AOBTE_LOCUS12325 [Acanthoscelides obtectus]
MGKWSCSRKLNSPLLCTIMAENSTTNYKKTVGINSLYKGPEAYNQAVLLMKVCVIYSDFTRSWFLHG